MKDILDCYPGIGTYVRTHTALFYSVLFCSVLFCSVLSFFTFFYSPTFLSSFYSFYSFFFFTSFLFFPLSSLSSPSIPAISLSVYPFCHSKFHQSTSVFTLSPLLPFPCLCILEEECLNLIIGGDVIACKNKALKSFVLFPRCVIAG